MILGTCILLVSPVDPAQFSIPRADPAIRVHFSNLEEIRYQDHPDVCLRDGILTLRGTNRTVVYRIDWSDYDTADQTYAAVAACPD